MAATGITFPNLFRRLVSLLYDSLLLTAIFLVATFVFVMLFGDATETPMRYFLQLYLYLIAAVYFLWCWLHGGQTLAMQTWRIRLASSNAAAISLNQAIKRYILASAGLIFFGAGYWWAIFDREGLFLHDRLLGTRLINMERG